MNSRCTSETQGLASHTGWGHILLGHWTMAFVCSWWESQETHRWKGCIISGMRAAQHQEGEGSGAEDLGLSWELGPA